MSTFRDEILKLAREHKAEQNKSIEESRVKKIKRWQAFRSQYEQVALQLKDLDGLKLTPRTRNDVTVQRTLSVRRIEELPTEPIDQDRVYPIELFFVHSDGVEIFKMGWIIHWRPWADDNKVRRTYADDDACWRFLQDDCLHRSVTVIGETAKALKYEVDLSEYEVQYHRGMDL